jgi:SdrD B-like domain/Secretion system C-terminal sorting domain
MNLIVSKIRITVQKLVLLLSCLLIWENAFSQNCPDLGNLTNYLFFFANGNVDANWQGATKGFAGNVAVDGIQAKERTSGGVPFAGTIYTNDGSLSNWSGIVSQNAGQATVATNQTLLISGLEADLANAFAQINAMVPSPGYASVSATSLNNLNTQNSVAETFVINITSGLSVSSKINITGDAGDCFVLRWDTDGNPINGYQGQTKFQSGGAIVPKGALKPSNFINVAGDINSSGGGSNPPAPYPQGPRTNNGTGSLISNASNFNGGGFFTGYWLTTGKPTTGESSSLSNGIFVGGWYTIATKFSMTSGTSGVYVAPNIVSPPPTTTTCIGEAANYVMLGLQGGNVTINSATNVIGDIGYSAYVTSTTNQKVGDDGIFNGVVYVHSDVAQFSYASQNFLPSGGIVQNSAAQNTRLDQANASAVSGSAYFAGLPPSIILGALGDNDSQTINRVANLTVVQITSLDYKEDQLTLVGQPGQNDAFVINVLGDFQFSGSTIALQHVNPDMVVFNFPNASNISINKASTVFNGTILAPTGSVDYHNPAVFNGGIVARNISVHSDFNINKKPLQIPCEPVVTGCLGDLVWNDLNQNGIKDNGEAGVPDVTVHLRDCQNNLIRKTQTDAEGLYKFKDLPAGCYRICVVLPDGFQFSPQNQNGNDSFDSDVATFNGCTDNIDLSPGENELTIDAGIFETDEIPCNCYGLKIAQIYMIYNGASCSDGNNAQSGEAICSGSIGSLSNTFIKVGKTAGGSEWFYGTLQQWQGFTIRSSNGGATQLDSDTYYTIGDQSGKFQTSCSKPIGLGDQFGGMQVLGIKFDDGSICGETEESSIGMVDLGTETLYFTAQKDGNDVSLYWVINTGFKTDYFEVERSLDGVKFELMEEVISTSDAEQMVNYQSRDENALMGINYYRLKQIFNDGSFRYSEIKEVTFHLDIKKFAVYPNPTDHDFFINLKEFIGNTGTISLHTDLGQTVYKQHLEVITADPIRIATSDLAPGVYAVTVQIEDKKAMTELLVVVKR